MRRSAASAELTRQVEKSTPAAYERVSKDDAHLGFFHSSLAALFTSAWSAHQMARPGAIAHSRAHLCPRASSLSLSSLVSPLRPLGLGFLLARGSVRSSMYFYVVTDAGQASHRVRLWQGGPASTYCRFRWYSCFYAVRRYVTGTRLLQVRLLGHPELRKRPWHPWRPRGDGNGGRFVRSPCFLRGAVCACCTPYTRRFPFLVPGHKPLGSGGDVAPCEDTREDFGLFV